MKIDKFGINNDVGAPVRVKIAAQLLSGMLVGIERVIEQKSARFIAEGSLLLADALIDVHNEQYANKKFRDGE